MLNFLFIWSVLAALCTVLGFVGELWWLLDLTSHFRVQYFFFLAATAFIFIFSRHYKRACFSFFFVLINVSCIAPLYFEGAPVSTNVQGSFRALTINLRVGSKSYKSVRSFIRKQKPDFLLLSEYDQAWRRELKQIAGEFPYSLTSIQEGYFGIGFFSRHPFKKGSVKYISNSDKPSVVAEYSLGGKPFTFIGVHLMSPLNTEYARQRNMQLEGITIFTNAVDGPKMLIGDLNTTSWSPHFIKFIRATDLKDTRKGRGIHPTWPKQFPFLLIPLDHCLVSNDISVIDRNLGDDIESDHYPITVDFSISS